MAGENVVRIVVKADNDTKAGFAEAKAGSEEAAAGMDEYAAAVDRATAAEEEFRAAQTEQADAQARLDELNASGTASADELAAAQDRVTQSTMASIDAQVKLGEADAAAAAAAKGAGDAAESQAAKNDAAGGATAAMGGKVKMAMLGVAVGMGLAVKGAADFQQQTVRLVTSAGESAKNLGMVQQGILSLSSATNTSTEELAKGMYMVESAGFHGADGLTVLKAAAEGAQAEGADLGEVANAVTSGLNAYGMKASQATTFTNEMVTAVGQGKMTMQDLASSMSAVLPIAASAHISFAQVGGAIATMTSQGMSARQASQDLANSIRALLNPNSVAVNEMNQFGISSVDVANKLGQRGLSGTIEYLAGAIARQMGPSGDIILKTFSQSRTAAADAETMLKSLPSAIQGVAKAYLDGGISQKQWTTDLKAMPPLQANLAREFATVADKAHGFNDLLKSGQPGAQTFAAALGKMMGGATGLNTALMLTGSHTATFNANVKAISDSAQHAGSDVKGWSDIQHEANFQIGSAEKAVKAMGDSLGLALLPSVTAVLHPLTDFLGLIAGNKAASIALATVVGAVLAGALGSKLAGAFSSVKSGITGFGEGLGWLREKLFATAAAETETAAATEEADAAMAANPVGAVIAVIVLLIVAIVELIKHWHQLAGVAKAVFRDVTRAVEDAWDWIRSHWPLLLEILTGPIGIATAWIIGHWRSIYDGAVRMIGDVTGWFRRLPGMILSAVGDLGSLLLHAGENLIMGLVHGIESVASAPAHSVSGIVSDIRSLLPFSPAKRGPLSGSGSPDRAGAKIASMLGEGILSGVPGVRSAASRMAAAAGITGSGAGSGGSYGAAGAPGGGQHIYLHLDGGDEPILRALREAIRARGGNVQVVLGQ